MLPSPDEWEISPADAASALDAAAADGDGEGSRIRLVDCREEEEFAYCRIEGARLVPLSGFAEKAEAALPDKDANIIVYCHHGMRSLQAAHFLRQRGYRNVWSLAGGIEAWSEEIDPKVPRY